MAIIKVSSADGVKFLSCFDTLSEVPFFVEEETVQDDTEPEEKNPFE